MLLSAEHISLNFGLKPLLDDVTLYLSQGDKVGLIGINGTGKSSFLRVLAGQQPPDQGSVTRDPNVQVCFLPQNPPMEAGATVVGGCCGTTPEHIAALRQVKEEVLG